MRRFGRAPAEDLLANIRQLVPQRRRVRLKYTRTGWYRYWQHMKTGTAMGVTGLVLPNPVFGLGVDIWVGPFSTAAAACRAW